MIEIVIEICYNEFKKKPKGKKHEDRRFRGIHAGSAERTHRRKRHSHLPYEILLGDKTFLDGQLSTEEMFAYVEKTGTLPKTSAINEFRYTEYFESLKKDYDAVVHISLSSGLTSSTQNAINAAKNVKNCYVVDSKALSTGIALLVLYAKKLADEGLPAEKIYEAVSARVPTCR